MSEPTNADSEDRTPPRPLRPRDTNQLAHHMVKLTTGQIEEEKPAVAVCKQSATETKKRRRKRKRVGKSVSAARDDR